MGTKDHAGLEHFWAARQAGCLPPACLPLRALHPMNRAQPKSYAAARGGMKGKTNQEAFITSRRVDSL